MKQMGGPTKRAKTEVASVRPKSFIPCTGGVASLSWSCPESFVVGGTDHQLKMYDVEKGRVIESILTQNKVAQTMDGLNENLILTGQEDGVVKLYDLRESATDSRRYKVAGQYSGHIRGVTRVQFNPATENVFISAGLDGSLKMWDTRNNSGALFSLKRKNASGKEDSDVKLFGACWNGPSQVLSGGSDSHISVHQMQQM